MILFEFMVFLFVKLSVSCQEYEKLSNILLGKKNIGRIILDDLNVAL